MKVLVATNEGQGKRKNDFFHADEGELVRFGSECDGEAVDGRCGCRRRMTGMATNKGTTTMKVIDLPNLTEEDFKAQIEGSLRASGWLSIMKPEAAEKHVADEAAQLKGMAEFFPIGVVLEKRGIKFQVRR